MSVLLQAHDVRVPGRIAERVVELTLRVCMHRVKRASRVEVRAETRVQIDAGRW